MSLIRKNYERLLNFRNFCRELGVVGTLTLLRQRAQHVEVFKLPVKGFSTPVYCRAKGSDFAVLRQVIGHQDAIVEFGWPPRVDY